MKREKVIDLLVGDYMSSIRQDTSVARDLLIDGFTGFNNYTNQELLTAAWEAELIAADTVIEEDHG